jgi:DNA-binding transcriptional regulator YdaS (Cro superfamily)
MNPLRTHLRRTGETATAFAERIAMSPSYLSRLMSGDREADATVLASILAATEGAVTPDAWVEWWLSREAA